MTTTTQLEALFSEAVEKFGLEIAEKAAAVGVEAYGTNALARKSEEVCIAEQIAAFNAECDRLSGN
jgi:hypothetical protein